LKKEPKEGSEKIWKHEVQKIRGRKKPNKLPFA